MIAFLDHFRNLAAVDRAIRSGSFPNATTMGKQLGVHARTVHRYFVLLRGELGAPLVYTPRKYGYRYRREWDFAKALLKWLNA